MSEEFKNEPLTSLPGEEAENVESAERVDGATTADKPARKNDPWKTAFIVLAGIALISAAVFYTQYANRNDLPTTPQTADLNAQPVQMGNPPTGAAEQLALSRPGPQGGVGDPAVIGAAAGGLPGGDGYDPWANPGRFSTGVQPMGMGPMGPYPVTPLAPPGQQVYMETNPNSPFMQDGNTYIMVPAPQSNTATNANANPRPNANTARPATSPTPATNPPAANTGAPATQPKSDAPAANRPVPRATPRRTPGRPAGTEEEDED